ncbi:HpcH/HpaI aldolase/citrate lyase family protein [Profundibacterium mesophilum]|uniref:Malyl-CoA thioesterase n=1 Tax=Profundibacterium mesophilum KAUST100406-0324 TaxID=1037889 RepID=A0A921NST4_9RHOB|nr:CoA ester lyase [Profundibacterium mesophilum]KAF0677345.1 malyl-CoA thioesterase [Profundibacterium mesophilum KAUST100406-0324]
MNNAARPWRSVIYIPGSKERAIDKARGLPVDAIIFDLEDAVAIEGKAEARRLVAQTLEQGGFGRRATMVRINGFATPWGEDDLEAVASSGPQAVLLPKVNRAEDVAALAERLDQSSACAETAIWAMIETPEGVLNAAEIARAPRMAGFVIGTNDLAKELGCRAGADRMPLMGALQACLLAARAAGIVCVDGVYNAFRDEEGLRAEAGQGRDLGMDGKSLIHPAQIEIANATFAPDAGELDLARRQIEAFEKASAEGQGIAVVDGQIVENLHVATARAALARADIIKELENA